MLTTTYHLDNEVSRIVGQFNLNPSTIEAASRKALVLSSNGVGLPRALWDASLEYSRPRVYELGERIVPKARLDDLVLPKQEKDLLHEIALHVAMRTKAYEEWGFGSLGTRGLGIIALFAGTSGTGKTIAAEVLANELHLDRFQYSFGTITD